MRRGRCWSLSEARFRTLDAEAVISSLRDWARNIGRDPNVLKIILFGSVARGDHTGSSDADVLVIVEHSHAGFLERPLHLEHPRVPVPVDLFVYTAAELSRDRPPRLAARALKDGLILYDRGGVGLGLDRNAMGGSSA